jgi:hypothetical protein
MRGARWQGWLKRATSIGGAPKGQSAAGVART